MVRFFPVLVALALIPVAGELAAGPRDTSARRTDAVVQVDFVFDNQVRRTRDLPTAALRAARRQMISGEPIGGNKLRSLADAGDGLAAFRYAKLLQEGREPDLTGAIAHYYAIAAYTGRAFAVAPLARLLKAEGSGYSESRLRHCRNAMTVQALSGNADAAVLLGEMYADGVPFGQDMLQAQQFLAMGAGGDNPKGALNLGVALMNDADDAAADHVGAVSALRVAASGSDLSVRVTAENLLRLLDASPEAEGDPAASPPINPKVSP